MSSPMRSDMQLLRATLAASLIFVAMAAIALAGPFEDILGAAEKGDYSTAHWLLRPLAEQGNAVAQFDLGFMYDTGHGVMQDYGGYEVVSTCGPTRKCLSTVQSWLPVRQWSWRIAGLCRGSKMVSPLRRTGLYLGPILPGLLFG